MGGGQPKNGHHVYGRLVRNTVEELDDLRKCDNIEETLRDSERQTDDCCLALLVSVAKLESDNGI